MSERTPHLEPTLNSTGSLARKYFDALYAARADPWEFESSPYEEAKYAATLGALPRPSYANTLEVGCSIGVFTRQLAARCEQLLAVDVSKAALAKARARCADLPQVIFEQRDASKEFPAGRFDLILVSEVAYYFSMPDLETFRTNVYAALLPRGQLLLVHYTGETNYPLTADQVHGAFLAWEEGKWRSLTGGRSEGYRLDLLEKTPR